MDLSSVTPLVLTLNESPNVGRTLARLVWAESVILLDSGSSDETLELANTFPNVRIHHREFDSHSAQWNYGIGLIKSEWVLALDADYIVSTKFRDELAGLTPTSNQCAFSAPFTYCVFGRPLRASVYPPRCVLFRKSRSRFVQDGHTQRLAFDGCTGELESRILHDDRKPFSRWIAAQDRYVLLEAHHLLSLPAEGLSRQDRIRLRVYFAPPIMFLYLLFGRGLILDGWQGWYYVMQRTVAEMMLSLRLLTEREKLEH